MQDGAKCLFSYSFPYIECNKLYLRINDNFIMIKIIATLCNVCHYYYDCSIINYYYYIHFDIIVIILHNVYKLWSKIYMSIRRIL